MPSKSSLCCPHKPWTPKPDSADPKWVLAFTDLLWPTLPVLNTSRPSAGRRAAGYPLPSCFSQCGVEHRLSLRGLDSQQSRWKSQRFSSRLTVFQLIKRSHQNRTEAWVNMQLSNSTPLEQTACPCYPSRPRVPASEAAATSPLAISPGLFLQRQCLGSGFLVLIYNNFTLYISTQK